MNAPIIDIRSLEVKYVIMAHEIHTVSNAH